MNDCDQCGRPPCDKCEKLAEAEAALAEARANTEALISQNQDAMLKQQDLKNGEIKDLQAKLAELQVKVKYNANRELADYERIKALKQERDLLRSVNKDLQAKLAAAEKGSDHWEKLAMDRKTRIAALEAEIARLKALAQKCKNFDHTCRGPCQGCSEYEPSRPPATHDKAHCPAVVHKGEYDRDTCYEDHAVVHVKEYFYTTGMDISGKQWHKVRAHTRRKPKRRR